MLRKKVAGRNNFHFICIGAVILFAVIGFAIVASIYFEKFDRTLTDENRAHLSEVADHITAHTQTIIHDTEVLLQAVADGAAAMPDENVRMNYLNNVAKTQGFTYLGWAGADGVLHATEEKASVDISGEEYYRGAAAGKQQITALKRCIFADKAVTGIILAAPMHGSHNETNVLVAMMDIANLQSILQVESFEGEGYSYIIEPDGELVLHSRSMDYNNFFRVLDNAEFDKPYSLEAVRRDIKEGRSGLVLYDNLGTEQYAYYRPLGLNSWTVVNIVAKTVVTSNTAVLTKELAFLGVSAIVVFLLLLVWSAVAFEISESRKKATEAKSAFLANMSHEIRTPMNAIVGISEILLREGLTARQKEYVLSIINSGKGLLTIVNDILDLSKIEAGKFSIVAEDYEVESLLYDVTSIIAVRIGDNPVALLIDIDPDLPSHLLGDVTRVKQILINILGNAAKFTREGYIKLTIHSSREENQVCLTMSVKDTGIGIKKQDLDSLFKSFNQVDTHHSHSAEGTGLGLAISKRLSEMMDGSITVESEFGCGSTFTVTIRQGYTESQPLIDVSGMERICVLLCESSGMMRDYYGQCMQRMGMIYKLCAREDEFEMLLKGGTYSYALADRHVVRRLSVKGIPGNVHLVTLLNREEQPLAAVDSRDLTVYAPLFSLQLASVIYQGKGLNYMSRREGADLTMIKRMPYVKILIVDDNEVNLQVATGLMEPYGMKIDCVLSGSEAVHAVKETKYDLVLMDHMMPDMDGVETLRKIRELPDERFKTLPVVALTANATRDAQAMFEREGFDGFLAKPIETMKLNDLLKKWLQRLNDLRAEGQVENVREVQVAETGITGDDLHFIQAYQNAKEIDFMDGAGRLKGLKSYVKLLATYQKTMGDRLKCLDELYEKDFERFIIEIHGLKGASAAIGAHTISELAQKLESLSKQRDLQEVERLFPAFKERSLRSLTEAGEFIKAYEEEHMKEDLPKGEEQVLPVQCLGQDILNELRVSFLNYDTEQLKVQFDRLETKRFYQEEKALIDSLKKYYEEYEFEKPLELIAEYWKRQNYGGESEREG